MKHLSKYLSQFDLDSVERDLLKLCIETGNPKGRWHKTFGNSTNCSEGQFIFSLPGLKTHMPNVSAKTIQDALDNLCTMGFLDVESTNLGMFITVKNWTDILDKVCAPSFDEDSKEFKMAAWFRRKVLEVNERYSVPNEDPESLEKWSKAFQLLNTKGVSGGNKGYSWEEIIKILQFTFADPFWRRQVQSPVALRKKSRNSEQPKIINIENDMLSKNTSFSDEDKQVKQWEPDLAGDESYFGDLVKHYAAAKGESI